VLRLKVAPVATASILVVDDEPAIQDILTWSLAAEGYNVATASSGE
jgi:CheY-like chemotaxis protein